MFRGDVVELVNRLFSEYEEQALVSAGIVPVVSDRWGPEEVYVARVNLDGCVKGVISYDSVDDALNRALSMSLDGFEQVDVRHIDNFRDALDELGFDRAVALLEQLEENEEE